MAEPRGGKTLAWSRATAGGLALAVLGWQGVNAASGRFVHPFLIADLVVGVALIVSASWPGDRGPALAMLAGFAAMAGVLLAASTGRLLAGGFDAGTRLAAIGVVPCLTGAIALGRHLHAPRA